MTRCMVLSAFLCALAGAAVAMEDDLRAQSTL
eukprot:CAMPEP_0118983204 /NCGR_PEP_ID=MMETSP1173-20130426/34771_1 /TAXON_ID=1034831 /ORGANISM="Rhizochromulina marina cf, Strain CCMP1243" /LENGTH=31 /DNA_ID= /DNA_START= /DNA_END= /DNA_ORIENTATION=